MRERNILKRLGGKHTGWIVGLDDHNNIIVQAPTGEKGMPTEQPGRRFVIDGGLSDTNADGILDAVEVPDAVMHFVHVAWAKQDEVQQISQRERELDEVVEETERGSAPTLHDLGFDDNPRVDSI